MPLDDYEIYPFRQRLRRAARFPIMLWRFRRNGYTWRAAWRLVHVWVWTDFQARAGTEDDGGC